MSTRASPALPSRPSVPPRPPAEVRPSGVLGTFSALRHRNYRLYFFGQLISLTGTWVQTAALTWLAFTLTKEQSTWPALVATAQVLPTLLLGVWGGSLADRWPKRPLILATQSAFLLLALLLAALTASGTASPWALLAVAWGIGLVNAVDTPSRLAFVIDMVGRDDLANAVALNSLTFNIARVLGPALGAWLLPWVGAAWCFLLNGLTFLAVLAALAVMDLPGQGSSASGRTGKGNLSAAFGYLGQHRHLVLLLVLAGALAFFGWPLMSLLPALSVRLGCGETGYSWMLSAIGAGALVGALGVASFTAWRRSLLAVGVALSAVSLGCLPLVSSLGVAVVCCVGIGGGLILFFATGQGVMQLGASDDNRGRIMGIWLMVLSGAHPLGHLSAGWLADRWGVEHVLALEAVGIALAAGVVLLLAVLPGRRAGE